MTYEERPGQSIRCPDSPNREWPATMGFPWAAERGYTKQSTGNQQRNLNRGRLAGAF